MRPALSIYLALGIAWLLLLSGCQNKPPALPPLPTPPAVPATSLVIPLSLPLQSLYDVAEAQLPTVVSSGTVWSAVVGAPRWLQVRYHFTRGKLALHLTDTHMELATDIDYRLEARRTTFPKLAVKDGSDEHPKHAHLLVTSRARGRPRLASHHGLARPGHGDRSNPYQFRDHRYNRRRHAFRAQGGGERAQEQSRHRHRRLTGTGQPGDANMDTDRNALCPRAGRLVVFPSRSAGHRYISAEGSTLNLRCQLIAHPNIVTGDAPAPSIPPLSPNAPQPGAAEGFHLALEGSIKLATANALLRNVLLKDAGKPLEFTIRHHAVRVTDISICGSGPTMLFALQVSGYLHGTIYLLGTIHYDPAQQTLYAANVDYTLATRNLLAQCANELFYGKIKKAITRAAVWSVADDINRGKNLLTGEINRTLAHSWQLQGHVTNLQPLAVYIDPTTITAALQVDGDATITLLSPSTP